jgi:drug/metabolite transporter (DMT)-like permease
MKPMFLFLFVAAMGNFFYHIGQKVLPQSGNPMAILMVVYFVAFVLSGVMMPFFTGYEPTPWMSLAMNWQVWLVALGVILIEAGFLLAYRAGGSVQWSGVAVNGTAALLLIPGGMLFFKDQLSIEKVLGIIVTIIGLYLLAKD